MSFRTHEVRAGRQHEVRAGRQHEVRAGRQHEVPFYVVLHKVPFYVVPHTGDFYSFLTPAPARERHTYLRQQGNKLQVFVRAPLQQRTPAPAPGATAGLHDKLPRTSACHRAAPLRVTWHH